MFARTDRAGCSFHAAFKRYKIGYAATLSAPRESKVAGNSERRLPAVLPKEPTLEERLAQAEQREAAVRMVLRSLVVSIRPFGFDKKRFKRCVAEEGEATPNAGRRQSDTRYFTKKRVGYSERRAEPKRKEKALISFSPTSARHRIYGSSCAAK